SRLKLDAVDIPADNLEIHRLDVPLYRAFIADSQTVRSGLQTEDGEFALPIRRSHLRGSFLQIRLFIVVVEPLAVYIKTRDRPAASRVYQTARSVERLHLRNHLDVHALLLVPGDELDHPGFGFVGGIWVIDCVTRGIFLRRREQSSGNNETARGRAED